MEQHSGKLVLAILQGEDYEDTVYELNQNGFCYDAQLDRRISKKAQHHHHDRR